MLLSKISKILIQRTATIIIPFQTLDGHIHPESSIWSYFCTSKMGCTPRPLLQRSTTRISPWMASPLSICFLWPWIIFSKYATLTPQMKLLWHVSNTDCQCYMWTTIVVLNRTEKYLIFSLFVWNLLSRHRNWAFQDSTKYSMLVKN